MYGLFEWGEILQKRGVTYEIECEECGDKYIGESSRNGYTRGKEHMSEYKNKSKKSVLLRHAGEKHDDNSRKTTYKMRVTGIYKGDPTLRQVTESVKIQNSKNIINNKCEWNAGGLIGMHIVRTQVQIGSKNEFYRMRCREREWFWMQQGFYCHEWSFDSNDVYVLRNMIVTFSVMS